MVKQLSTLLNDRDKNVREEGKLLTVQIYKWIPTIKQTLLEGMQPVQVTTHLVL